MSYDVSLYRLTPSPDSLARQEGLVAALLAQRPQLLVARLGTVVELTNHEYGIQLRLQGDSGAITVPYSHNDSERAQFALNEVWDLLDVCEKTGGFVAYDRQLGRALNLKRDRVEAMACYFSVASKMPQFLRLFQTSAAHARKSDQLPDGRRPWWKFWA